MSEIKVNKISPATGTAFTMGDSGDTFTVPSGATIVNSGTATGFGGGNTLQVKGVSSGTEAQISSSATWTGTAATEYAPLTMTFTPTLSGSILMVDYDIRAHHITDYCGLYFITYNHSGISETSVEADATYGSTQAFDMSGSATSNMGTGIAGKLFLSLATTNEITFMSKFSVASSAGSGTGLGQTVEISRTYGGNNIGDSGAGISTFTVTELASGITTISDTNIDN